MPVIDEVSQLIEHLYSVDRILLALQQKPNNYAGELLHANEAHTLKAIAQKEGISQMELSERMLRTKGATSVVVDKLVAKGLVIRTRVNGDQRRYLLTLTEKGWLIHRAHLKYDELHAQLAADELALTTDEVANANRVLERVIQFYSTHYLSHGAHIAKKTKAE